MIKEDISKEILNKIKESNNILLHLHPSPDADSFGSALSMKFFLEGLGKKATVIKGDSDLPEKLSFLPGFSQVVKKNYFELDLKEFDLFIILDAAAPKMISRVAEVVYPPNFKTILIDHHVDNTVKADISLVIPEYAATSLILFKLFKLWNVKIDGNIAQNLFAGIYQDTGGFKYGNTDAAVFETAASLAREINVEEITNNLSLVEIGDLKFECLALQNSSFLNEGKIAFTSISYEQLKKQDIDKKYVSAFYSADNLKYIRGVDVAVCITEEDPGNIKMSFRTIYPQRINVAALALKFGGGGHKAASGAFLKGDYNLIRENVIKEVLAFLSNNS